MMNHPTEFCRWLDGSRIDKAATIRAATITVCTGTSEAEVLRAFGARASPPVPARTAAQPSTGNCYPGGPFVQVLQCGPDVVLAIGYDGGEGTRRPVLARGSMLADGEHVAGWDVLHEATNPDPPAAVTRLLEEVGRTLGEGGPAAAREVVAARS